MSEPTASKSDLQRIREDRDGDRPYILHPENDEVMVRTGKQIIEHCQLGISIELWLRELHGMLEDVRTWCGQRSKSIRACFLAPRPSKVSIVLVPRGDAFDFNLADDAAGLMSHLCKDYTLGMIEVGQVPWTELDRFMDLGTAKGIYGEQPEAHPAVET